MDASNRTREQPTQRRARSSRHAARQPAGRCDPAKRSGSNGLKLMVRVVPLPDHESNPLRARQLAVILDLLRSAASEAAERDAAPREHAQA